MGLLDRLENEATGTNAAVRKAAMYLMAFAVVNVGRELTYLIASVQHDGAPTIENYQAVFFSILSMFMGGLTRRLRVFSRRAWYSTIFIGAFLMLRIAREFWVFLNYVLSGVPNTDYQCLLLGFAGSGEVFADEVGADGQFAVAAIDQHRQLHAGSAAEFAQSV